MGTNSEYRARSQQSDKQFDRQESARQNYRLYERERSGNSGYACFPRGTPVWTPSGPAAIEALRVGDAVISCSKKGILEARPICKIVRRHNRTNLSVELGRERPPLRITPSHSLMVNDRWTAARHVVPGDRVKVLCHAQSDLRDAVVTRVSSYEDEGDVYNLIIEDMFVFVANGVIAHSFTYFRSVRQRYWQLLVWLRRTTRARNAIPDRPLATL
jgi:hypothetical protein